MISPADKEGFIQLLRERVPQIHLDEELRKFM